MSCLFFVRVLGFGVDKGPKVFRACSRSKDSVVQNTFAKSSFYFGIVVIMFELNLKSQLFGVFSEGYVYSLVPDRIFFSL
jgi:hypothetical protein